MQIHNDIAIMDLALRYKDILILGDLQLGYEESLARSGYLIPRFQFRDVKERLTKIISAAKIGKKYPAVE